MNEKEGTQLRRGKGMKFVGDSRVLDRTERNTIPKDYSEYPGRTEAFWPNFLLKEWLVGAVFLIGFLCLVAAAPSPLETKADPNISGYVPLPDWYFLFLYQLLKYPYAAADYVIIGTLVIPGLAFGALLLAPFLDKGPERRMSKRPIASGLMILGVAATIWLTYESAAAVDWEERALFSVAHEAPEVEIDETDPGYEVYTANCMSCHGDALQGQAPLGPKLLDIPYDATAIKEIAVSGIGNMPANMFQGTDEELELLANFIVSVNEQLKGEGSEE